MSIAFFFLGRVALGAQRPIVTRLSRGRSVGLSVRPCVGLWRKGEMVRSVGLYSVLLKNSGSDPDAVWHHSSDGSRDKAGSEVWGLVHGKGYFGGRI